MEELLEVVSQLKSPKEIPFIPRIKEARCVAPKAHGINQDRLSVIHIKQVVHPEMSS